MKSFLGAVTILAVLGILVTGCSGSGSSSGGSAIPVPSSVQGTQGNSYTISVFAKAPGALQPDDMLQMGSSVFVVYQDTNVNPDGTLVSGVSTAQAEVIEYDLNGKVLQTFKVPGHPDGMVAYNSTTVWVSSNEDGNSVITAIDPTANTLQSYTDDVAVLPHERSCHRYSAK